MDICQACLLLKRGKKVKVSHSLVAERGIEGYRPAVSWILHLKARAHPSEKRYLFTAGLTEFSSQLRI